MTDQTTAPAIDAPPPRHPGTPAPRPRSRRLDGLDAARALAIIGMVAIHVGVIFAFPLRAGEFVGWLPSLSYGRASTLFAFVAGVGITLGSRRGSFGENAARLAWRAAWLAPLGLLLEEFGTPVAVILQFYAVWFLLAIPFLRAPTWLVGGVAAVGYLVGPTILVRAQVLRPEWYSPRGSGAWMGTIGDVLLTGWYPTVSWLWVVLLGMVVGRLDLGSRTVATALALVGGGVAAVVYTVAPIVDEAVDLGAYDRWFSTIGHADTPPEMVAASAVAVAVLGVCLLLADLLDPLLVPLAMLGRLALTVYVGHIFVYAVAPSRMVATDLADLTVTTLTVALVGTVFAMLWLSRFPRGPLETLDRNGWEYIVRPMVTGEPPPSVGPTPRPGPAPAGRR